MVNQEIVARLFVFLTQYLNELKVENKITWENFLKDIKVKRFVERTLQMSIEVCLDVGNHIISDEGWKEASTNREIFQRLNEKGAISNDLTDKLLQMAGFRNRIIHDYSDIEPEMVFGILKKRIPDFELYMSEIFQWIDSKKNF